CLFYTTENTVHFLYTRSYYSMHPCALELFVAGHLNSSILWQQGYYGDGRNK
ncbi:MAG: hypothetical protein ACI9JP_003746, partial [Granulosicoccus sp.]